MKTLSNHVLIYDKDCPMCDLYTSAFIKTNMLDKTGRIDFCSLRHNQYPQFDSIKAKDEIALINTQTGSINYGIDSLFKILSHRYTLFNYLFQNRFFKTCLTKLYKFISFNRKVIAPAKVFESKESCTPSFNLKYRWAYIIVSWIFTSTILNFYTAKLIPILPATTFSREWLICGGQIVWQSIFISMIRKDRLIHYLGNMMTVSNIGALLLTPFLFLSIQNQILFILIFCGVVMFMLFEHYRRTKILGLSIWASVGWVAYRFFTLALIYFL